ncbi:MAG TPA: hypothetical protein VGU43_04590 [Thermoplasmata archaeon]|nr:hypothetical protein [Thermoplasmata archaeon]
MPGKKRSTTDYERVGVTIPRRIHDEMLEIMRADPRWFDRVEFVREALKEKIERWKKEHPLGAPPGAVRRRE